jgi:transposase
MSARREVWIGIDVAKHAIDVAAEGVAVVRVARTVEAVTAWAESAPRDARVVLEATGGYEQLVATVARARGMRVSIVNPRQVRDFAKALGHLAKTDRIDAQVLARFGAAVRPRVTLALSQDVQALRALLDRRRQLVGTRTAEKNRRTQAADRIVVESIDEHLAWLEGQIAGIDRAIDETVRTRPELRDAVKRFATAPGVGRIVATTLLTHLPELGAVSRKHVAALAGLAPFNRDSGQWRGRRAIWGGRAEARAMLFLAAQTAARWHPPSRDFYGRLLARGKSKKAAMTAVARKLLIAVNAMARDERPWQSPALA